MSYNSSVWGKSELIIGIKSIWQNPPTIISLWNIDQGFFLPSFELFSGVLLLSFMMFNVAADEYVYKESQIAVAP